MKGMLWLENHHHKQKDTNIAKLRNYSMAQEIMLKKLQYDTRNGTFNLFSS